MNMKCMNDYGGRNGWLSRYINVENNVNDPYSIAAALNSSSRTELSAPVRCHPKLTFLVLTTLKYLNAKSPT